MIFYLKVNLNNLYNLHNERPLTHQIVRDNGYSIYFILLRKYIYISEFFGTYL